MTWPTLYVRPCIKNVPYHADVKKFGEALCNARAVDNGAKDPGVSGEAGEGREDMEMTVGTDG
jgi:hypothetical protein